MNLNDKSVKIAGKTYINFCVETLVPEKTVKVYPNNKPRITKAVKDVQEKTSFWSG